jgi:tRNA(Ile)-lysidine synthase
LFRELDLHLTDTARAALDRVIRCRSGQEVCLSCARLLTYPAAVQEALLQMAVQESTGRRLVFERVAAIAGLVHQQSGRVVELGDNWKATRTADEIVISAPQMPAPFLESASISAPCIFPGGRIEMSLINPPAGLAGHGRDTEYVDADKTGTDGLIVRSWHEGDTFVPLGMAGHKNVSDLLNEAGVPSLKRGGHPLLATADGEIVWVCGLRIAERFKVTGQTRRVLHLKYQRTVEETHGDAAEDQW